MKAIQYKSFGKSDVLELKQVDKPGIKENEVFINVKATTINPLDMKIRSGYIGVQLLEQGKIKAAISKVIKLEQAAQAQDLVSAGGVNGKIVLEIN